MVHVAPPSPVKLFGVIGVPELSKKCVQSFVDFVIGSSKEIVSVVPEMLAEMTSATVSSLKS